VGEAIRDPDAADMLMTVTCGASEYVRLDVDDPRKAEPQRD
jgi:hypothetical protein